MSYDHPVVIAFFPQRQLVLQVVTIFENMLVPHWHEEVLQRTPPNAYFASVLFWLKMVVHSACYSSNFGFHHTNLNL